MGRKTKIKVPHRRRREKKTDYHLRLGLLKSGKPRLVVRRFLKNLVCQVIKYNPEGDETAVSAEARELRDLGWKGHTGNLPAAYLTGFLCGKKALENNIKECVLDMGLYTATKGARVFAALKGAVDAGLEIPHSDSKLPDENRIRGEHIANYAEKLKKDDHKKYRKVFSEMLRKEGRPEKMAEEFERIKEKILKGKGKKKSKGKKKAKKPKKEEKKKPEKKEKPTMDWLKKDLKKYAQNKGVDVKSSDTKKDILKKIEKAEK